MIPILARLKELVEYVPHPPPGKTGAKYIIRDGGQRLDLRYLKESIDHHLELGYKASCLFCDMIPDLLFALPCYLKSEFVLSWLQVERHLNDGDSFLTDNLVFIKYLLWGIESRLCHTQLFA